MSEFFRDLSKANMVWRIYTIFELIITYLYLVHLLLCVSVEMLQIDPFCTAPRRGICIDIWKCPYYVDLLHRTANPQPPSVIADMRKNLCGFVDSRTPKVCCSRRANREENPTGHRSFRLLPTEHCGEISNEFRITEGRRATLNEFPWMALIVHTTNDTTTLRCGGTLITDTFVLTAAHCLDTSRILGVRLGEYNILTEPDCNDDDDGQKCRAPVEDFLISKIIIHPLYDAHSFINDIALIKVATTIKWKDGHIQPICLPWDQLANSNLAGKDAVVAGWGVTEAGKMSSHLLKTLVPIWTVEQCQLLYRDYRPITKNQICAGGAHGRDTCAGDSGGPLMHIGGVNGTPRFVQFGIVSYGPTLCGLDGRPAVYTKVAEYLTWILDNLE